MSLYSAGYDENAVWSEEPVISFCCCMVGICRRIVTDTCFLQMSLRLLTTLLKLKDIIVVTLMHQTDGTYYVIVCLHTMVMRDVLD